MDVFENSYNANNNRDSKKLTSIAESPEMGNEGQTENLPVPKVAVNGVDVETSEENFKNDDAADGKKGSETKVYTGNNNETAEVASTVSGPTFYGVALVEPCSVEQVQVEEAQTLDTPEVKVTCIREESLDKEDEPLLETNDKNQEIISKENSCLDENLEDNNEQVINLWVICQFIK